MLPYQWKRTFRIARRSDYGDSALASQQKREAPEEHPVVLDNRYAHPVLIITQNGDRVTPLLGHFSGMPRPSVHPPKLPITGDTAIRMTTYPGTQVSR
jgi:hypothetical protein